MPTVKIDSSIAPKLREWFAAGRGVRVWENQDLSSGRAGQHTFTPADVHTPPYWSLTDKGAILPADVTVQTFTPRFVFTGAVKRRYWGMDVSDATRRKAVRLTTPAETWTYTINRDYGRTSALVEIGALVEAPL